MSDQYLPTYIDNVDNSISIMNNENAISYYKNNGDINTVSAKNIAHKKVDDNLNLCAFDGSNFNSVISINNSNSNCEIMTNLNVSGNVNLNNDTIIGNGIINTSLGEISRGAVPIKGIIMWSGTTAEAEALVGWALCIGGTQNGITIPDLRDRFIVGAGSEYSIGATGGANTVSLSVSQIPSHNHSISISSESHSHSGTTSGGGGHSHTTSDWYAIRKGHVHTKPIMRKRYRNTTTEDASGTTSTRSHA